MKTILKIAGVLAIMTIFASCKPEGAGNILSNESLRKEIMDSIANDHALSMEMMNAMMNSEHGKMMMMGNRNMMGMMMGNQQMMRQMMKENPAMRDSLMNCVMVASSGDSLAMMGMCKRMMENPQMLGMMHDRMMKQNGKGRMRK